MEVTHKVHVVDRPKDDDKRIRVVPGKRVEVNENESVTFGCEIKGSHKIVWSHKVCKLII